MGKRTNDYDFSGVPVEKLIERFNGDVGHHGWVADTTVYTMAPQGEPPAFKVRAQWRLRRTDIDASMPSPGERTTKQTEGPRRLNGARK